MRHIHGEQIGGLLQKSIPDRWDWSKDGGEYKKHCNFFSVHWEVQERDPSSIRLHIESPKYVADPFLNELKQEMVTRVLASGFAEMVQAYGYQCRHGSRVSPSSVQNCKSTEPFRVVLTEKQRQPTTKQDIALVHDFAGSFIDQIVHEFTERLDRHFDAAEAK